MLVKSNCSPPDSIVLQKSNQDVMPFLTGGILMIEVVKDRSLGGEVLHFQDEVQDVSNKFWPLFEILSYMVLCKCNYIGGFCIPNPKSSLMCSVNPVLCSVTELFLKPILYMYGSVIWEACFVLLKFIDIDNCYLFTMTGGGILRITFVSLLL